MSTVLTILNKVKSIDLRESAVMAMEDTAPAYRKEQQDQLFKGLDSKEAKIEPAYTARTVAIKSRKGQPTDRVTLKDKGDFYRGIFIDVRGDIFVTESMDSKSGMLQKKYGTQILGLGLHARIEYIRTLRPVFINKIKQYLK